MFLMTFKCSVKTPLTERDHDIRSVALMERCINKNVMAKLWNVITRGWPTDKAHLNPSIQPFRSYRDELTTQNAIIYKGLHIFVPPSMHTKLLHSIFSNHLRAESNIRMAKEMLFWPGMRRAIHDMCTACAKYGQSAPKEPMNP